MSPMFTGLQVRKFPAQNGPLTEQVEEQEESKGRSPEAAPVQDALVTGQSVEQAIPAKKGNPSGLVEGQSAPALPNVPVAGSALLSVGQLLASPGTSTNHTGIFGAAHTSCPIVTDSY